MSTLLAPVDDLLRAEGAFAIERARLPWRTVVVVAAVAGFLYGAVMGWYGGRPLQSLYSGLKVPLLLACAMVVVLPNFFVINTILGLRDDLQAALRGVLAAQGTLAVCLASLAPITALGYASTGFYPFAKVLNGAAFALASAAGHWTLARHYRPLIASNPRHRVGLVFWLVLYVFVAIQLAWILRPFIGRPGMETAFFREGAWGNAYVEVLSAVWDVVGGR